MVLISDIVRSFITKLFLKVSVFSRNNNTRTQLVEHTAHVCLYFIAQRVYKKGVRREKEINAMTFATHRTYKAVHDPYHCAIY
jgi:hypothetical protein